MYEYIYLFNLIIIDFKDSMIYIILVINLLIAKMRIIRNLNHNHLQFILIQLIYQHREDLNHDSPTFILILYRGFTMY